MLPSSWSFSSSGWVEPPGEWQGGPHEARQLVVPPGVCARSDPDDRPEPFPRRRTHHIALLPLRPWRRHPHVSACTYVRAKEFLVYPFYEYTHSSEFEYKPSELGFAGERDFFGKLYEHEFLLFVAYAFNDSFMIELESALYATVDFRKSGSDTSAVPSRIEESGLGDTDGQIRWRFLKETEVWPEATAFFGVVFPLQRDKKLLGSREWEFVPGIVLTKGFSFGTFSLRLSVKYDTGSDQIEFGEYAVDYEKRLSPNWRIVLSVEGEDDELSIIGEVQYALHKNVELKINSGFGITKKAPDYAPEIGVLFRW